MRILFLSNFYPPIRAGGYAQLCQEVAWNLQERGHVIKVLTSNYRREKAPEGEQQVLRNLHLENDLLYYAPFDFFTKWRKNHAANLTYLKQAITDFDPDVLMVWGMWGLSISLPALGERLLSERVVYYLADYWPVAENLHSAYWRLPARRWLMRLPKRFFGLLARAVLAKEGKPLLEFKHILCVSAALKDILIQKGLPIPNAQVVHNGINLEDFIALARPNKFYNSNGHLKLLYAGQLAPHKGVHTAIEAMANLVNQWRMNQVTLTIIGEGHPSYESYLHTLVQREGLDSCITFREPVSRGQMPAVLHQFDALVFPSVYEEPLARITQEAMASGLVVIGTDTGGTKEILVDGENGLIFSPEDAEGLAGAVAQISSNRDLRFRLANAGRRTVLEKFTLERMVNEIEAYLINLMPYSADSKIEAV